MDECQHSWKTGPVIHMDSRRRAVCVTGWHLGTLSYEEAKKWPEWTDEDYEANKETVERVFG